jgi:hypothetical protein
MTRILVAAILASITLAALLWRCRTCADLADAGTDDNTYAAMYVWRDIYPDRLASELGMTERCRAA